jgi:hypothetical protein
LWEDLLVKNTGKYLMLSTVGRIIYTKYWETLLNTVGRFIYTKYYVIIDVEHCGKIY